MKSEAEDKAMRQKAMKRYKCWGCCLIVTGIILLVTACFTPKVMDKVITSQAQKSAQLTQDNEDNWRGIPGHYDIGIYWNHYLYNCSNWDAVSIGQIKHS